jgi:hypothetical protein
MTHPDPDSSESPMNEQQWKKRKMAGFNPQDSAPWKFFQERYGERISKEEIISLGQVCVLEIKDLKLHREYRRRKATMIKWFDEHWDAIRPFLETKLEVLKNREDLQKYKPALNAA